MRSEQGKGIWIYGLHSVRAVLSRRAREVEELVISEEGKCRRAELTEVARNHKIRVRALPGQEISALCGVREHQGIAVRVPLPAYVSLSELIKREAGIILALDGITDPHNLGAMIRTAEAFGISGVVVPQDRAAQVSPVVHKTSAGAVEWLPVCRVVNLSRALREMKEQGYWIYAADPHGQNALSEVDFAAKTALVIGSEGKGLRPGVMKEVDFRLRIDLVGHTQSLNASVACAIFIYKIMENRNQGGSRNYNHQP